MPEMHVRLASLGRLGHGVDGLGLGRVGQVAANEGTVEAIVRALGETDGLLGNTALYGLLHAYVPSAVLRLELAATAACGSVQ